MEMTTNQRHLSHRPERALPWTMIFLLLLLSACQFAAGNAADAVPPTPTTVQPPDAGSPTQAGAPTQVAVAVQPAASFTATSIPPTVTATATKKQSGAATPTRTPTRTAAPASHTPSAPTNTALPPTNTRTPLPPTNTPLPSFLVTSVSVSARGGDYTGPCPVDGRYFDATITANGPGTVTYQWYMSTDGGPFIGTWNQTMNFISAGSQSTEFAAGTVLSSRSLTFELRVSSPNAISNQATMVVTCVP